MLKNLAVSARFFFDRGMCAGCTIETERE